MVTLRQRTTVVSGEAKPAYEEKRLCGDQIIMVDDSDDSSSDSAVKDLRGRWELASVLNFLNVFGPLVSNKLKLTAEEIEMGLIESNSTNAQLHIALLKGISPPNKSLDDGDAWITVLCKKLEPWWPWIANGEIPITARKGEEISEYQGLDPIDRLKFLKALCELRVDQDDVRSYIQEKSREGFCDSLFRKRKLGGDGKKTYYWFDGNDIQGYRLYKEVDDISKGAQRAKSNKNPCSDASCFYWETEATSLDDFQRVARELSSSKASSLASTGETIETDAIPVVEKLHKKKEKAIQKKMKQKMFDNVNYSCRIGFTRSCRNRRPATYTYEEFDRMISEAVEETEETDQDDEEGIEKQSALGSTKEEAPESDNDDVKENERSKEDAEPKEEFNAKNRLRQRVTRNSALSC